MKTQDANPSLWSESSVELPLPALNRNLQCDVCIVGAGFAGLSTAYHLQLAGKSVIVLDKATVGAGQSGRCLGILAFPQSLALLEKLHGVKGAALAFSAFAAALHRIKKISAIEKINCDWRDVDGYLLAFSNEEREELRLEHEAYQRIGPPGVDYLERAPFAHLSCLRLSQAGFLHPLKYLQGLAQVIQARGGKIFSNAQVESFEGGPRPSVSLRNDLSVTSDSLVVATQSPINDRLVMHTKQMPFRLYFSAALIPKDGLKWGLYRDQEKPSHDLRVEPYDEHFDLAIVSGEEHKTGQGHHPEVRFRALQEWLTEHFLRPERILRQWSSQVVKPLDGLGFIGHNPLDFDNVLIATGESGQNVTYGTIAGMLLSDILLGRTNPWENLFAPSRLMIRSLPNYLRENFNTLAQYAEWLARGEVANVKQVKAGEGAIFRSKGRPLAVYRDEQGFLHACSAVCPHLEGIVAWNAVEKSWDCPCHGSRFDCDGHVINGPSPHDLSAVKIKDLSPPDPAL